SPVSSAIRAIPNCQRSRTSVAARFSSALPRSPPPTDPSIPRAADMSDEAVLSVDARVPTAVTSMNSSSCGEPPGTDPSPRVSLCRAGYTTDASRVKTAGRPESTSGTRPDGRAIPSSARGREGLDGPVTLRVPTVFDHARLTGLVGPGDQDRDGNGHEHERRGPTGREVVEDAEQQRAEARSGVSHAL